MPRTADSFAVMSLALGLLTAAPARAADPASGPRAAAAEGKPIGIGVLIGDDRWTCRIEEVLPGGPADKAGLKAGDVIIALDGHTLASTDDGRKQLRRRKGVRSHYIPI